MTLSNSGHPPSFTVVTPSFNQGTFIRRTIESVLSQGIPDLEYLINDGGSTDDTVGTLKTYDKKIRWVSERDAGQSDAVNKGLLAARGDIIGWLNSDDIYYPGALRAVKDIFDSRPDIDVIYGMADHIDENDSVIEPYYSEIWSYERLQDVCFLCQPAVFFRRALVEKYGPLDVRLRYCMDYEYWLRIGRAKPFYFLNKKLAGSRLHADTKTLGSAVSVHEEILDMFKNKFGKVPSSWIYNHAHIVARTAGLTQDGPLQNWRFARKISAIVLIDAFRYRHYIKPSELTMIAGWLSSSFKALRNSKQ